MTAFVNHASVAAVISRKIAAYKVACGVSPPGLVQYPFLAIASIIALAFIRRPGFPENLSRGVEGVHPAFRFRGGHMTSQECQPATLPCEP